MSDNRRDQLIEFVEREFIGPDPIDWPGMTQSNGQEILASDPPRTRYIAGILYPAETTDDKADLKDDECELLDEADGEDVEVKPQKLGDGTVEFLEDAEELINRSNAYRQSAISITVSVKDGDAIRVAVSAGTYIKVPAMDPATGERLENKYKYPRTALAWENDNVPLILPTPTDGLKKFPIGTTGLQFDITYRYRTGDSRIYTFTLENAKPKVKENVSDEECFFQCKFKLFSEKGFSPLSDSQRITQDEDYQSNQLLYRNVRNYAIGHGCAADWDDSESVLWITTAIFPKYDIKPIVPSAIKGVSLDMLKMSPYGSFADTIRELRMMCAKYREWINGLRTIRQDLSAEYKITADRHITNCETCLSRMEKGVELLEQNENIRIAFQYMNLAMLILATGSSSDATTAIRLFASLLYGAKAMRVDSEKDRDPYWTNMGYYNSIRELGQAATWIRADIDQHLDVMYKRRFEDKRYPTKEEYRKNRRYIWRDEELTSRISGSEVTASLANLGIRYPGEVDSEGKIKEHPIDICLATNMISVGLDVSRLGLMTVAGQPKTTSEYIQATSRVGRDAENAPGLVFVLYRPGRPRDKSHYEQFRSYHSRVYCNVEPTSVTPFSAPVRERALHAIMVGMMRLESDDRFNEDPPRFPDDGLIDKVRSVIENRVDDIDSEELDATLDRMEYILQCWEDWNPRKWEPAKNPDWSYADPVPLMYSAGSHPNEAWGSRGIETPTSMRSVDASCEAEVLTNRYVPKEG